MRGEGQSNLAEERVILLHRGTRTSSMGLFIFAACEWFPTNYRLYSKIPTLEYRTSCVLCLGNKTDTMEHLLECPALATEQRN